MFHDRKCSSIYFMLFSFCVNAFSCSFITSSNITDRVVWDGWMALAQSIFYISFPLTVPLPWLRRRSLHTKSSQLCIFSDWRCPFSETLSIGLSWALWQLYFRTIAFFPFSLEMTLPSYASTILKLARMYLLYVFDWERRSWIYTSSFSTFVYFKLLDYLMWHRLHRSNHFYSVCITSIHWNLQV